MDPFVIVGFDTVMLTRSLWFATKLLLPVLLETSDSVSATGPEGDEELVEDEADNGDDSECFLVGDTDGDDVS